MTIHPRQNSHDSREYPIRVWLSEPGGGGYWSCLPSKHDSKATSSLITCNPEQAAWSLLSPAILLLAYPLGAVIVNSIRFRAALSFASLPLASGRKLHPAVLPAESILCLRMGLTDGCGCLHVCVCACPPSSWQEV